MNKEKTKLTFYGHNCFVINTGDTFLAIDPWLSEKGAFFGSWFQWPQNHHLQDNIVELTKRKRGCIFITHEHEDHFDVDTLRKINKNTKLLIPDFQDKFLLNKLIGLGFDPIELTDSRLYELTNELSVKIFISDIGINHDSAILVTTDEFTFLNQNDCKIFDRLDEIKTAVTYYSAQFSGATSHPVSYSNYSSEEKKIISQNKIDSKIKNIVEAIRVLEPDFYVPAAGPAIFPFLDENLSFGADNIFIHQDLLANKMLAEGISNIIYAIPGDEIGKKQGKPIQPPSLTELINFKKKVACQWDAIEFQFDREMLLNAVTQRLDQIWDLDFECEFIICLRWEDSVEGCIYIDLENKSVSNEIPKDISAVYEVVASKKYFSLMCGSSRWQDISLSLRAELKRKPDIFNNFINIFMYSDVSNIRSGFISSLSIPKERIQVLGIDGLIYETDRYCPHQGADLKNAIVNNHNQLVCPRHSWCFSLKDNGSCVSNNSSICSVVLKS
jgi:UDP-MurNAc hydroxylase